MLRFHVTLSLTLGFLSAVTSANTSKRRDEFVETILMPDAVSDSPDTLMCTSRKLAPEETYITKFIPHATKDTAHHMVVFGCEIPASNSSLWSCNGYESTTPSENAVCGLGDRQILFAWAMDAPEKTLPEGVGLRVSGATRLNYLVVQMHYAKAFPPGVTDSSGISLTMTRTRPPQQLGYYILGNWGFIPPQKTDYHMDSFCKFDRNFTIYPIGYRTHSHNLGVVTSGYRIRDGEWLEIGRMSPQLPQTFYPVTYPGIDIRPGDLLASRCTMNSMDRTSDTPLGATNHDEMCNFYIMYSTYEQGNLSNVYCFEDSRSYSWLKTFRPEEIPRNSGLLDGIPGADFVRHKFKML